MWGKPMTCPTDTRDPALRQHDPGHLYDELLPWRGRMATAAKPSTHRVGDASPRSGTATLIGSRAPNSNATR